MEQENDNEIKQTKLFESKIFIIIISALVSALLSGGAAYFVVSGKVKYLEGRLDGVNLVGMNADLAGLKERFGVNPEESIRVMVKSALGAELNSYIEHKIENEFNKNKKNFQEILNNNQIPVGVIIPFAGHSPPDGWLFCDGSPIVPNGKYKHLFSLLERSGWKKNSNGNILLPDLSKRFPIGRSGSGTLSGLGDTGGTFDHTHVYNKVISHAHGIDPPLTTTTEDGKHKHTYPQHRYVTEVNGPQYEMAGEGSHEIVQKPTSEAEDHHHFVDINRFLSEEYGSESAETLPNNPPYLVVNYIIKY